MATAVVRPASAEGKRHEESITSVYQDNFSKSDNVFGMMKAAGTFSPRA